MLLGTFQLQAVVYHIGCSRFLGHYKSSVKYDNIWYTTNGLNYSIDVKLECMGPYIYDVHTEGDWGSLEISHVFVDFVVLNNRSFVNFCGLLRGRGINKLIILIFQYIIITLMMYWKKQMEVMRQNELPIN